MQIMPWDVFYQKLLPAYGAGKGPGPDRDERQPGSGLRLQALFQPLDDVFSGALDTSTLVAGAVDAGRTRASSTACPVNYTPLMLFYNKKLFTKAGHRRAARDLGRVSADLRS